MPSPAKTTDADIVAAARRLIETRGRAELSMADVAAAVGVRTPSLYGRFVDRAALLAAVELSVLHDAERILARVNSTGSAIQTLTLIARAYRAFGKANPQGYALVFAPGAAQTEASVRARTAALAPAMAPLAVLVGEDRALAAARVLTPFLHGFVSMENAGAFRFGGGLDAAFEHGVATILAGLSKEARAPMSSRTKGRVRA